MGSRGEQSGGGTKTMTAQHLRVAAAAIVWAAPVVAFSPSLVAPGGPLPVRLSSRPQVPGVTLLRPTTGLRAPALQMAGAGGAAVNLDSSDFDQGDADPIGSIDALNQAVPRPKITELIKQSSDTEGFKQVLWHVGSYVLWRLQDSLPCSWPQRPRSPWSGWQL